ncbi:MAG TPA: hypothetical protein PKD55_20730, partial [Bellilinea sp.]|nr:hypothetical protein [Bellilinea sp.]
MKIKRSILTVMLFAGLFLAACNTAPGTEIKPTDAATTPGLSGVATKPQMTVSTDAPPQISATPASTATPTPDASAVGEIVMVEEPTLDVESISKVVTAGTPEIEDLAVSTNGRWKITLVKFPCAEVPDLEGKYSLDRVEVTNVTAQTTATVDEQVMLCGGLGAHGYKNLGWGLG